MKISLLTDAPKHNLALMKLSAWHKANGDDVLLNAPIFPADYTYASVLFERNATGFIADEYGGPAFAGSVLPAEVETMKPDYDLFETGYSLGYTFRPCFNTCHFCKVPKMDHPDTRHHSIWEFHDSRFGTICLLNNNAFQDPQWKETFEEIWDAGLSVKDENGYDLRLIDDEKAAALKRTRFVGKLHFAWDRMQDEALILNGLEMLRKHKISGAGVYVLIGYNTALEDDIYRCQKIIEHKQNPYIMPYKRTKQNRAFKRFIDSFMWRKHNTVKKAWEEYAK
jgi:hypothetical protein